jgi:predicted NodU family carbamoyl transferase
MIILGVTHPISWNNAACLLIDGKLVAFVEEERFTRVKHAPRVYPEKAVEFCLSCVGVKPQDVGATAVGFERCPRGRRGPGRMLEQRPRRRLRGLVGRTP